MRRLTAALIDTETTYPRPFQASWTPSPDRTMMSTNPKIGDAFMDVVVWLRSLGLGSMRRWRPSVDV